MKIPRHSAVPFSKGQARVESISIRIKRNFDSWSAHALGPEFLTYVLWPSRRRARDNLGEVLVEGSKSKLGCHCAVAAFALIVTAEPYFAVTQTE